jgi:DsbC/DsbD-like thiol-disulfide interchange protein
MRLVALAPDADGQVRAALQIEPHPGWITYWREPGESGIPPQITLAADRKAVLEKVAYPVPKPIALGDIREIGYDAPVSLPLDFRANGDSQLDITAFIGVCKDICIPFQANLSVGLPPAGATEGADAAIIAAANGSVPAAPSADFAVQSHSLSADGKALSLHLTVPEDGDAIPQVYVTGPSGYVFFKQAGASRTGRDVATTITIGKLPKSYTVKGKSWSILVVDGQRAMETTLAME